MDGARTWQAPWLTPLVGPDRLAGDVISELDPCAKRPDDDVLEVRLRLAAAAYRWSCQ
jgi:hypothetical protein